jgi:ElaB/YqjD/DUF883 family membrane-anchored ribosome-binding protein
MLPAFFLAGRNAERRGPGRSSRNENADRRVLCATVANPFMSKEPQMGQTNPSYQSATAAETEDAVRQLKRKAEETVDTITTEGARAMKSAGETAETAIDATKRFVQSQPLLAIGAVAAFAFTIGSLWKLAPRRNNADMLDRLADYVEPGYRALRRKL